MQVRLACVSTPPPPPHLAVHLSHIVRKCSGCMSGAHTRNRLVLAAFGVVVVVAFGSLFLRSEIRAAQASECLDTGFGLKSSCVRSTATRSTRWVTQGSGLRRALCCCAGQWAVPGSEIAPPLHESLMARPSTHPCRTSRLTPPPCLWFAGLCFRSKAAAVCGTPSNGAMRATLV